MRSHLSIVGHNSWEKGILLRKSLPTLTSRRELPMFSSSSFTIPGFMLRLFIHLKLGFMQSDRHKSEFILLHMEIRFPASFADGAVFPVYGFGFFVKYLTAVVSHPHIWVFCFVPLVASPFLCLYHVILITIAL